jgi:hypothetical protein
MFLGPLEPGVLENIEGKLDGPMQIRLSGVDKYARDTVTSPCSDTQLGKAAHGPRRRLLRWQDDTTRTCSLEDVLELAKSVPACFTELRHPFEGVVHVDGAQQQPTNQAAVAWFAAIRVTTLGPSGNTPHLDHLLMVHGAEPHCLRQLCLEELQGGSTTVTGAPPVMDLLDLVQHLVEWGSSIRRISLQNVTISSVQGIERLLTYKGAAGGVTLELNGCKLPDWGPRTELELRGFISPGLSIPNSTPTTAGGTKWPSKLTLTGCRVVPKHAYREWKAPTTLQLPAELTDIHIGAFINGDMVIDFGSTLALTRIHGGAFFNCSGLSTVTLPISMVAISLGAFCRSAIQELDLSACSHLNKLGRRAFADCIGLKMATLGGCSRLRAIEQKAFHVCTALTSVTLPDGLTAIADQVFESCTSLATLDLPRSLCTLGVAAFRDCGLASVALPCALVLIGDYAFQLCTQLERVVFGASNESPLLGAIGRGAFLGCARLQEADLSRCKKLVAIPESAFSGCIALANVKLPVNLKCVKAGAFGDCISLTSIDLSGCISLESVDHNAFDGCVALQRVHLPSYENMDVLQLPEHCELIVGPMGPVYGKATNWARALRTLAAPSAEPQPATPLVAAEDDDDDEDDQDYEEEDDEEEEEDDEEEEEEEDDEDLDEEVDEDDEEADDEEGDDVFNQGHP